MLLLLLLLLLNNCEAGFQTRWHGYIASLLRQHAQFPYAPVVIAAPLPPASEGDPQDYLLPDVIIWDPVQQFPAVFGAQEELKCFEPNCGLPLQCLRWQDGYKPRYNPRSVYGLNGPVFLVGQILHCSQHHQITTCDPRVLAKFSDKTCIPFILLHRCGWTRDLSELIFTLAAQGLSFSDIEALLYGRIQERYYRTQIVFLFNLSHKLLPQHSSCTPAITSLPPCMLQSMSNDEITYAFLSRFNEVKGFFAEQMHSVIGEQCSCDHTFKLAKHIGVMRNGRWIPQYDSLFILQNEIGEILYWQLTMGTSYSTVEDGLQSLSDRMKLANREVNMMIIDNCCMWRQKITDTFGKHIQVKLDLFHAVKRVASAASKRHPFYYAFLQDFRLVFRVQGDAGPRRKQQTPPPHVLIANMEVFLDKWRHKCMQMNPIITNAVQRELDQLKKHMERGCLSNIPCGFGTNRNENLHRSINKCLSGHKIGVDLAVALLATFFHMWNIKRTTKQRVSPMGSFYMSLAQHFEKCIEKGEKTKQIPDCGYRFGIGISHSRQFSADELGTAFDGKLKRGGILDELWRIQEMLNDLQTNFTQQQSVDEAKRADLLKILLFAMQCLYVEDILNGLSDTHPPVGRIIPCQLDHVCKASTEGNLDPDVHQGRLQSVLTSFNLKSVEVPPDGDCVFHSVIRHLQLVYSFSTSEHKDFLHHLQSLGYSQESSIAHNILLLRRLLVDEWLSNRNEYQPFFTGKDFESDALQYVNPGTYSTDLGDAMVLGIANVLQTPIVIFTSIESWPYVPVQPRHVLPHTKPIFLAYIQDGPGHYNLAIPRESPTLPLPAKTKVMVKSPNHHQNCRCGRGYHFKDKARINCSSMSAYTSRCPCIRSGHTCTITCKCINCGNGKCEDSCDREKKARRKRQRHPEQEYKRYVGVKYMKDAGEQPLTGQWTADEHYVFLGIIKVVKPMGNFSKLCEDVDIITELYSSVLEMAKSVGLRISLSAKSSSKVRAKINAYMSNRCLREVCGHINFLPSISN